MTKCRLARIPPSTSSLARIHHLPFTRSFNSSSPFTHSSLHLSLPGIAINKDGTIFFADGTNVRMIDEEGNIWTLVGSQGQPKYWRPILCQEAVPMNQVVVVMIACATFDLLFHKISYFPLNIFYLIFNLCFK